MRLEAVIKPEAINFKANYMKSASLWRNFHLAYIILQRQAISIRNKADDNELNILQNYKRFKMSLETLMVYAFGREF